MLRQSSTDLHGSQTSPLRRSKHHRPAGTCTTILPTYAPCSMFHAIQSAQSTYCPCTCCPHGSINPATSAPMSFCINRLSCIRNRVSTNQSFHRSYPRRFPSVYAVLLSSCMCNSVESRRVSVFGLVPRLISDSASMSEQSSYQFYSAGQPPLWGIIFHGRRSRFLIDRMPSVIPQPKKQRGH